MAYLYDKKAKMVLKSVDYAEYESQIPERYVVIPTEKIEEIDNARPFVVVEDDIPRAMTDEEKEEYKAQMREQYLLDNRPLWSKIFSMLSQTAKTELRLTYRKFPDLYLAVSDGDWEDVVSILEEAVTDGVLSSPSKQEIMLKISEIVG